MNEAEARANREMMIKRFEAEWDQIKESITYKHSGPEMVVASILSDAQEELAIGRENGANLRINFAKFILGKMMEEKRES